MPHIRKAPWRRQALTGLLVVTTAWPQEAGATGSRTHVAAAFGSRAKTREVAGRAPAPVAPTPRVGLGLGLGLTGAAALGVGVGLLIQHRRGYAHFESAPNNAGFVAALGASTTGAALVGVGTGLVTAAMTVGLVRPRVLDRWLWTEVAVGGAVALIGTAWYAREWQRVQRDLYDGGKPLGETGPEGSTLPAHDIAAQRRETAAAAVLGAGAGLLLGAAVALLTGTLVRRHGRRRGAGLSGGPVTPAVGLALHGRF